MTFITKPNKLTLSKVAASLLICGLVAACDSDKPAPAPSPSPSPSPGPSPTPVPPKTAYKIGLLPDTQGGTDAYGQAHVAIHPMEALLKHQKDNGVNMVLALGDLTDHGSQFEFDQWRAVAEKYQADGMEFFPVMGNHEEAWGYTVTWIENMKHFIPKDAKHMPGSEWINYYVIRDRVLVIGLAYYHLPRAFEWIKDVVESNSDDYDHIVVASHDGLIGAKYGQTREQIVEGTKEAPWVEDVQPQIREYFAKHDVIYAQGHEHQYQRSLVSAKRIRDTHPSGSTPSGENYRMPTYTQIISGNASYKGYEYRYGERDLVQAVVSQKNATMSKGSESFDVNSSFLTFTGDRIDYAAYYAEHTAKNNAPESAFTADWKLMDKFSRSKNRCESIIFADTIPDGTRGAMVLTSEYKTNECIGTDGTRARLVGGKNQTFNRTDTRERTMSYTAGLTKAETLIDLTRLNYQWLWQQDAAWTPNLNHQTRALPDVANDKVIIPGTTFDLKEHLTLSWLDKTNETASDILLISGLENQTGVYQSDYGLKKDIQNDEGVAASGRNGEAKPVVQLPESASESWDISDAIADRFAVSMTAPDSLDASKLQLGIKTQNGWQAITQEQCVIDVTFNDDFVENLPLDLRDEACIDQPLVGFDSAHGSRFWAILDHEGEVALINK